MRRVCGGRSAQIVLEQKCIRACHVLDHGEMPEEAIVPRIPDSERDHLEAECHILPHFPSTIQPKRGWYIYPHPAPALRLCQFPLFL